MLYLGVLMHTARGSLPSSTLLHEPCQAPAFLSRPLWLQTPTTCCPLAADLFPPGQRRPKQPYFPLCLISPSLTSACLPSWWCSGQGVLPRPCVEARAQSQWGAAGLSFFLPTPASLERREQKTEFVHLNFGFSQKSAFSEEPQL